MYTAIDLSKYIITKCSKDYYPITNLQLQKILYFIQRDFLIRNSCAFADRIEAWKFGPVVPASYYRFCGAGGEPIFTTYQIEEPKANDIIIINNIVEEKRAINIWELVNETHIPGGAWDQIYQGGKGNRRLIPIDLIRLVG